MGIVRLSNDYRTDKGVIVNFSRDVRKTKVYECLPGEVRREKSFYPLKLGYINPCQVKGYFVDEDKTVLGCPELNVWIDFVENWIARGNAGEFSFQLGKGDNLNILFSGTLLAQDVLQKRISPEYISKDDSGIIIPITLERISEEVEIVRNKCDNGKVFNIGYLERLARVGLVDAREQIRELKVYCEKRKVEVYSSTENLETVLDALEELEFNAGYDGDNDIYVDFVEMVERVKFPNQELKDRACRLLTQFAESYANLACREQDELDETVKERKVEIDELKIEANRLSLMRHGLKSI